MNAPQQRRADLTDKLTRYAVASLVVHLLVLLIMLVGLPSWQTEIEAPPPAIIIELAELDDVTPILKPNERPPSPPPPPSDTPPTEVPVKPPPPTPPEPPQPPDVSEVIPPPRPPDAMPEMPEQPPPPKPPEPEPPPKPKPPPPKPVKPKPERSITDILNNLEPDAPPPPAPETPAPSPVSEYAEASGVVSDKLTMSEADLLRQKLSGCWSLDPGRLGAGDLTVDLNLAIGPDMRVIGIEIANPARYYADSFYRAATDEARKAIECAQPLPLPAGAYDRWKNLRLRFDPRSMIL